ETAGHQIAVARRAAAAIPFAHHRETAERERAMDALQALTTRVSAPGLTGPAPDEAAIQKILTAATRAADHGRMKPWRFIIIREGQREAFGQIMAEALKRRRPDADEGMLKQEAGKPLRAPMIIVVVAHLEDNGKIPEIEQVLAVGAA